jgi:hypothetical protein
MGDNLKLDNVTLISMTSVDLDTTIEAMKRSCEGIDYGDVVLITHETTVNLPEGFRMGEIDKMNSVDDYSYNMIYKLGDYINTDYALIIQADGFVVNSESWRDEFLDYDYIGAPFALPRDSFSYRDVNGNIFRVGNGGFSLRSKKLINLPVELGLEWKPFHGYYNEDGFICAMNRHIYEENGCKFAPLDVAKYFSHEAVIPEIAGITPFGFHGKNNIMKYKKIKN